MELNVILLVFSIARFASVSSGEQVCGRPLGGDFRLQEDRIVAGYDIGYYRYPWYAALIRYNMVTCGAALIAPKTILTAAHCYKEFLDLASKKILSLESIYTVKLGVYNTCETESSQREFPVAKVHVHDLYPSKKPYYDICLLKLIGDTDMYTPICLPPPMMKKKPPDGTVPGLGTLRYHGAMPCTVHEARLLIHNDSTCRSMMNSTGNNPDLIHKAFCAGYLQGGIDTCQGDSGGPLQSMNVNGDYVLIGVVSFGFRCADPGLLGVYTDVSEYDDWIKEKSKPEMPTFLTSFNPNQKPSTEVSSVNNNNEVTAGQHHHHHHNGLHILRPYRRPIKLIVFRNNHLQPITKLLLHRPIIRYRVN